MKHMCKYVPVHDNELFPILWCSAWPNECEGHGISLFSDVTQRNLRFYSHERLEAYATRVAYEELKSVECNGVLEEDPSCTLGVTRVMNHMCKYVPVHDNEPIPNLCCGDQMSVKNIVSASLAMSPCETEDFAHIKGLEPTPQDWHMRNLSVMVYLRKTQVAL